MILQILTTLSKIYLKSTAVRVLETIIKYFTYICDSSSPFQAIAGGHVKDVRDKVMECYSHQLCLVVSVSDFFFFAHCGNNSIFVDRRGQQKEQGKHDVGFDEVSSWQSVL